MAKSTIVPIHLPGGFVVKKQYGSRYWMVIDPVGVDEQWGVGGRRSDAERHHRHGRFRSFGSGGQCNAAQVAFTGEIQRTMEAARWYAPIRS